MLEPLKSPTVVSYIFNISSCNCNQSVLLFNKVLHWMQQVIIREILVPPMTHNQTLYNIPEKTSRVVSPFGKFATREDNLLYSIA